MTSGGNAALASLITALMIESARELPARGKVAARAVRTA